MLTKCRCPKPSAQVPAVISTHRTRRKSSRVVGRRCRSSTVLALRRSAAFRVVLRGPEEGVHRRFPVRPNHGYYYQGHGAGSRLAGEDSAVAVGDWSPSRNGRTGRGWDTADQFRYRTTAALQERRVGDIEAAVSGAPDRPGSWRRSTPSTDGRSAPWRRNSG